MGRDGGLCRGLGGSMHLVDVEHGFMGATGVVGGNIPIALGSALAARLRGDDSGRRRLLRRRCGAGGPLQRDGQPRGALAAPDHPRLREQRLRGVHAALGAHDRRARQRRRRAVRARADDRRRQRRRSRSGRRSAATSLRRATGRGPFLLECLTHRLRGHYEGDPGAYREALAAAEWQERDPIQRLAASRRPRRDGSATARCRRSRPTRARRSRRRCGSRARARSRARP